MALWHLTLASDGRLPLFPSEAERRHGLLALARVALHELVLFCIVDDHLHAVLTAALERIGHLRSALSRALGLSGSSVKQVESRSHMQWLVRYLVTQPAHHKQCDHPALWTGSCFQDLVGARVLGGLRLRIADALPRLRLEELCEMAGLGWRVPAPVDDHAVRAAGAPRLALAAAAAVCAPPGLAGHTAPENRARTLVAVLGSRAGIGVGDLAWATQLTPNGLRRHLWREIDERESRAVRMRLALEAAVEARRPRR
jgi:hypothetical protein